jgi:hypothetical protein
MTSQVLDGHVLDLYYRELPREVNGITDDAISL